MRVRLTDGTREVSIRIKGHSRRRLDDVENAAARLLDVLAALPAAEQQTDEPAPFGYSLDSTIERAEQHDVDDQDDEPDDRTSRP